MQWLRKYPRLYGIVGICGMIIGVAITFQSLFALFSNEPLIPLLMNFILTITQWQKILLSILGLAVILAGMMLLVLIFKQTAHPKGPSKIMNLLALMASQNTSSKYRGKTDNKKLSDK